MHTFRFSDLNRRSRESGNPAIPPGPWVPALRCAGRNDENNFVIKAFHICVHAVARKREPSDPGRTLGSGSSLRFGRNDENNFVIKGLSYLCACRSPSGRGSACTNRRRRPMIAARPAQQAGGSRLGARDGKIFCSAAGGIGQPRRAGAGAASVRPRHRLRSGRQVRQILQRGRPTTAPRSSRRTPASPIAISRSRTTRQREQALRRLRRRTASSRSSPSASASSSALEKVAAEFPNTQFAIIDMVVDAAERPLDRLQGA